MLLLDVTPLSLGLETLGSVMTTLIPRNTTIPTKKMETFSTAEDNQTAVDIHVLQGERPMARDNKTLGTFRLDGLPPAPRGIPQIEVTFDIDANGILHVTAKDKATGKEQQIQITASTNLSEKEVEQMVNAAQQNAAQDQKFRELVEARNQADQLTYAVEKSMNELGEKLAGGERANIEGLINDLRDAVKGDDINRIRTLSEQVQQASYAMSQQLYQSQEGQPGSASSGNGHGSEATEGVVEGEFEEV